MKKFNLMLVALIAGLMFMPKVDALTLVKYGEVKDITESGHPNGAYTAVSGTSSNDNKDVVFDFTDALSLYAIDKESRPVENSAWIGFGIKDPTNGDGNTIDGGSLSPQVMTTLGEQKEFPVDGSGISAGMRTLWVPITAQELREAVETQGEDAVIRKTFVIYWSGANEEATNQTITLVVHPKNVTITKDPSATSVDEAAATWDETALEEAIKVNENNKVKSPVAEEKAKEEVKENNPDTSDMNVFAFVLVILTSGCGLTYTIKKRFN